MELAAFSSLSLRTSLDHHRRCHHHHHHHHHRPWILCQPFTRPSSTPAEAIIYEKSYKDFGIKCHIAASNDASSENMPEPHMEGDRALKLHDTGLLQLTVREANLGDYWEVADTHCCAFFPHLGVPMDTLLRVDRVLAMIGGSTLPSSRKKTCLVAVDGWEIENLRHRGFSFVDFLSLAWKGFEQEASQEVNYEKVLGILTVDTVAEFLPRRKPTGLRRTGIAYISNVAVRQRVRRQGIAKRLVQEAELVAAGWGCRSIALHCDINNPGALALYLGAGYKLVSMPVGAKWPHPKVVSGSEFSLMMKRLPTT